MQNIWIFLPLCIEAMGLCTEGLIDLFLNKPHPWYMPNLLSETYIPLLRTVEQLSKGENAIAKKNPTEYCYIVFNVEIRWCDC